MIASVNEAIYDDYMKVNFPNFDVRREDLKTLANFARQYESAGDFLDQLALLDQPRQRGGGCMPSDDNEMVTLSSVHQAKGLEWKVVFVIWMADGMFPSSRSLESEEAIEEERRLFICGHHAREGRTLPDVSAHAAQCGLRRDAPTSIALPRRSAEGASGGVADPVRLFLGAEVSHFSMRDPRANPLHPARSSPPAWRRSNPAGSQATS